MTRAQGVGEQGSPFIAADADEQPTEFLFNVDLMARMDELGLFDGDDRRIELRAGRLIRMAPPGPDHGRSTPRVVHQLMKLLEALGLRDLDVVEANVTLAPGEAPVPDAAVVRGPPEGVYYVAGQTLLAVEVAKSSLRGDLSDKRDAYAAAGIPEYWVVNIRHARVHVFRAPGPSGYEEERTFGRDDVVSPLFADGRGKIAVADLLP